MTRATTTTDEGTVSFGAGFESVLDALRPLLPTCPLNWHYRSRDERLVAFSNDRIYGGALTTFPGVARDDCLRHVVVAQDAGAGPGVIGRRRGRPRSSGWSWSTRGPGRRSPWG